MSASQRLEKRQESERVNRNMSRVSYAVFSPSPIPTSQLFDVTPHLLLKTGHSHSVRSELIVPV